MRVIDFLAPDCIIAALQAKTKPAVLTELSGHLAKVVPGVEAEALRKVLEEREQLASTAIGDSIAIPLDVFGGKMRAALRNRDGERGTFADRALHADRSAVQLDQLVDQRKTYAAALVAATASALDAVKTLEHARQSLGGNAGAGVPDAQFHVVSGVAHPYEDAAF